jgi:hypothetical protein
MPPRQTLSTAEGWSKPHAGSYSASASDNTSLRKYALSIGGGAQFHPSSQQLGELNLKAEMMNSRVPPGKALHQNVYITNAWIKVISKNGSKEANLANAAGMAKRREFFAVYGNGKL